MDKKLISIDIIRSAEQADTFFGNQIADESSLADENEGWLSTEKAAEYLGISAATLRNLCSNSKVPYYKWQRRNRFLKSELRGLVLATKRGGTYGY